MSSLDPEGRSAICVIGNLNADGRLSATNEEMAAMENGWLKRCREGAPDRYASSIRSAVARATSKSVCWSNSKCSAKAIDWRRN